ncbi:MAG: flagellar export protein FliJ [Bdellovibrionales bacterium GWB1_55_8]|nr:MAG: flagellar export protein FliJ [Bdellovibrionales bacterium GWB1_55_8]
MRRFRFRLATVLNLRKSREEEALRALGDAQRAYQEELSKKGRLVSELQNALIRRENLGIEPIGVLSFQLEDEFIAGTKHRIVRADRDIMRASRAVEKALKYFLHTRRQTRMMESLYDREHAEFRKMQSKREQKLLDDMSVMRDRLKERAVG